MLLELGDPIGPDMTFPPFALARSVGVFGGFGEDVPPLTDPLTLGVLFAEEFSSFLDTV